MNIWNLVSSPTTLALAAIAIAIGQSVISRNTARRQLRAYMTTSSSRVYLGEHCIEEIMIEFRNCGQTPAYEVQIMQFADYSMHPLGNIPAPQVSLEKSSAIVGAGEKYYTASLYPTLPYTNINMLQKKLQQKDQVFSVRGICAYKDIFGAKHELHYQLIMGGPTGALHIKEDEVGRQYAILRVDMEGNHEQPRLHSLKFPGSRRIL